MDKKVRPVATQLPTSAKDRVERARFEPSLRDPSKIGHTFTEESLAKIQIGGDGLLNSAEISAFRSIIAEHGKAFAFTDDEIGCVDPRIVPPMVIFTIEHTPWKLKPIPKPMAHYEKLLELLQKRITSKLLEPCSGPYANRWFTVPKKDGKLRFIQDIQPANRVTIRNSAVAPVLEEYVESFAGRAI